MVLPQPLQTRCHSLSWLTHSHGDLFMLLYEHRCCDSFGHEEHSLIRSAVMRTFIGEWPRQEAVHYSHAWCPWLCIASLYKTYSAEYESQSTSVELYPVNALGLDCIAIVYIGPYSHCCVLGHNASACRCLSGGVGGPGDTATLYISQALWWMDVWRAEESRPEQMLQWRLRSLCAPQLG